ncbi:hypothetical protein AAFN46_03145 [Pseudomonas sp. CAU 1711]|uniref:hypothetical protein n=1 Tax=Pseudomonas sp. CAU 1711 TaxID=3140356 RepID=UPI00325FE3AA
MPTRPRIGNISNPSSLDELPELPPHLQILRDDLQKRVQARRVRHYLDRELSHLSGNREIAASVRLLFDGQGRPSENLSLKEIVRFRQKIETDIQWMEAVLIELRSDLGIVQELEDAAMDVASIQQAEEDR